MSTYRVIVTRTATYYAEVEAGSESEAIGLTHENFPVLPVGRAQSAVAVLAEEASRIP